jgi:tetratricopeptide (TPR) repeat protein
MASASQPTGTLETALAHTERLLVRDPATAAEQAREILRVVPGQPRALALYGEALAALGQRAPAIAALREATARDPNAANAWRTLGDQLILVGDGAGADAAYAGHIRASVHDPLLREAAVALADNRLGVAERLLKDHLKAHPTDVAAIRMLAELAGRIGRNGDAEVLLTRALELAPSFTPARFNLATVYYRQHRAKEAVEQLDRLLADEPAHPAYRNLKGAALSRMGDFAEAAGHFEEVLAQRPDQPRAWMNYGHVLKTLGRSADCVAAYRRALALLPGLGEAWWSLANLKTIRFTDADVAAMEAALERDDLSGEDRFHLEFALGKAQEDAARPEPAFRHYAEANRLRRLAVDYDPDAITALVTRSIALFTPAFFAERVGQGAQDRDAIFILGMPRAGSTLIEQILATHPQVEGTQELPDIQAIARRLGDDRAGGHYPASLTTLAAAELAALGREYLDRTRVQRKTKRPLFVDKMPNNWAHIGLIQLILPNATIIDARRHPLGCCFSNFKQHFARGQAFSYDLAELGRYYADYVRYMAHIDAVLPGRVHRVFHEAMVEDSEREIRRLLDAVGLPFDPACLRFWENDRAVQTASAEQVRRPINREGVDAWERYAPWLAPLRAALGPVLELYPTVPA